MDAMLTIVSMLSSENIRFSDEEQRPGGEGP